ncbi:MAG: aminoacyl-tRNA hydrolase [Parcubacteria group bacterium]|nr:aminoacyl-tRNA hydrolase [Parcubacteria group bacterium]
MYLIIGLGNPEEKYEGTRHNAGRDFIEYAIKKEGYAPLRENIKLKSLLSEQKIGKEKTIIAAPLVYMNESGKSASALAHFYKIKKNDSDRIVIIHDDVDIPFGSFKISFDKSAGGHKGVQSVIDALHTQKFVRFRVGTNPRKKHTDAMKIVLGKFTPAEQKMLNMVYKKMLAALLILIEKGYASAMGEYNKS